MLIYTIYLTIGWAVFALLYHTLLAQETFFGLNRRYLLATLAGGLLLPWCGMRWPSSNTIFENEQVINGMFLPEFSTKIDQWTSSSDQFLLGQTFFGWIWLLGIIIGVMRFIYGLSIIVDAAQQASEQEGNMIYSDAIDMPFSFFRWIFIPTYYRNEPQLDMIIRHEQAHCSGWHSMDILFSELVCIFFWWHPLAYWYKRALRAVHEYIADQSVTQYFSRKQYGLLLIKQAQSGPVFAYANHFLQSPLKQRLSMLTKHNSAPVRSLRYALVMPFALLLFLLFQQNTAFAQLKLGNKGGKVYDTPEKGAEFSAGGESSMGKFLAENIKYPPAARKENAEGLVVISFVVNKSGNVEDVKSLKPMRQDLIDEAIRVVKLTKWIPASNGGKVVKSRMTLPIKFKLG
jgi:TonB family protein